MIQRDVSHYSGLYCCPRLLYVYIDINKDINIEQKTV